MKRLMVIVLLIIPLLAGAQNNKAIDRLFDKYANKDGFKRVTISGKLINLANKYQSLPNGGPTKEAAIFRKITGIRILSVEDKEMNKSINFYKELESDGFLKSGNYELFMEVTDKNETVRFYGQNAPEGKFSELLLVIGGNENTVISIQGLIDPAEIGTVTGALDMDLDMSNIF